MHNAIQLRIASERLRLFSYSKSLRQGISIGLKMDFPAKAVTKKNTNNLLMLLGGWITSSAGRY